MKFGISFCSNNKQYSGLVVKNKDNESLTFNTEAEADIEVRALDVRLKCLVEEYYYGNNDILNSEDTLYNIIVAAVVSTVFKEGILKKHYHIKVCKLK